MLITNSYRNIFIFLAFLVSLNLKIFTQESIIISPQEPPKSFEKSFSMILHSNLAQPEMLSAEEDLNKELQRYRTIAYRVLSQTPDARTVTFHYFDDDSINAFAIPGGFIFITKGMLKLKLADDEIAHLLGHEIAHLIRDHHIQIGEQSLKSTFSTLLVSLALTVAAINNARQNSNLYTDDSARKYNEESIAAMRTIYMATAITNYLFMAKYTREMERDADLNGRKYAARAGYSKNGAESLFSKLSKTDNHKISLLFRTHPYMEDRASSAKLAENISISENVEVETQLRKSKTASNLLSYIYNYQIEQREILSKERASNQLEYVLLYSDAISLLAKYAIAIDSSKELNSLALRAILKQELLKFDLGSTNNQWGVLSELYEMYNPTAAELSDIKQKAEVQKLGLLKAIRLKTAGVPACKLYLSNFKNSEETKEIQIALLQSFLITKDILSFEYYFQKKSPALINSKFKDELILQVKKYINLSKRPYQLYTIVKLCNEKTLDELMMKKLPELIKSCHNLKEINSLSNISFDQNIKSLITNEKIEENIEWNFAQAKFLEKEKIKQKALEIYNDILTYASSKEWKSKAQDAIDTLAYE